MLPKDPLSCPWTYMTKNEEQPNIARCMYNGEMSPEWVKVWESMENVIWPLV